MREFPRLLWSPVMRTSFKTALAALAFAGAFAAAPASAQSYGPQGPQQSYPPENYGPQNDPQNYGPPQSYGPQGNYGPQGYGPQDNCGPQNYGPDGSYGPPANYGPDCGYGPDASYARQGGIGFSYESGGYCDQWGCPDDYWDMPVYYGPVFFGDEWFNGPVYFRDWYGRRQFWIHGGWHFDEWRGPRPSWWHAGRVGPALGLNFYQSHGFHGRWDNGRGFSGGRGFARPDAGRAGVGGNFAAQNRGNFAGRNFQPQNNAAPRGRFAGVPQQQHGGGGHESRPQQQARNNGGGDHGHHH